MILMHEFLKLSVVCWSVQYMWKEYLFITNHLT